jgi:molecular chaperone GrpE
MEERNGVPGGRNQEDGAKMPSDEETAQPQKEAPALPEQQPLSQEQQLEEEKKKSAEYLDNWRRSAAEFSNYKKRVEKERAEYSLFASSMLLGKLLDVMDGFDAAFNAIPEKFRSEPWVEGIRLVEQKLKHVLETEGVKPIEAHGKEFDPNFHEAMFYEQSPGDPEGRVIGEFQRGYMLGDRVLRPTRVKVSKGEGNSK